MYGYELWLKIKEDWKKQNKKKQQGQTLNVQDKTLKLCSTLFGRFLDYKRTTNVDRLFNWNGNAIDEMHIDRFSRVWTI